MQREDDPIREEEAARELLAELNDLRDLDRRRQAHPPGTEGYEVAAEEVDTKAYRVMNRFRDAGREAPRPDDRAASQDRTAPEGETAEDGRPTGT